MLKIPRLLLGSIYCLCFTVLSIAQSAPPAVGTAGGGDYFRGLVKDAKTRIQEIGVAQLGTLQKTSPILVVIDVREDNEWATSRVPGAIHVGRGVLEGRIESRIPQKSTPIVVYCQSGARSSVAADVLGKMGYTNVSSLAGGLAAYQAAALPLDTSAPPK